MSKKQRKPAEQKGKKSAKAAVQPIAQAEPVLGPTEEPTAPVPITEPAQPPAVEPQAEAAADTVLLVTQRDIAADFTAKVLAVVEQSADESGVCRMKVRHLREKLGLGAKEWRSVSLALQALEAQGKLHGGPPEIKISRAQAEVA